PLVLVVSGSDGLDVAKVVSLFEARTQAGQLSHWAIPTVQRVDEIPKTSVGKIDKKKLRSQYG
ncbi:MAG: fatty acid--CoA ligase, partial [Arenicellales bacterium]